MIDESDSEDPVDKTPTGSRKDAKLPTGEVLEEYGVVDLSNRFPAETSTWNPEGGPTEEHVIVPFRVVSRGFRRFKSAKTEADRLSEEHGGQYKAVQLNDQRGL